MNKILTGILWLIAVGGILGLLGFINHEQQNARCEGIRINIDKTTGNFFIEEKDIKAVFANRFDSANKRPISFFDLTQIETQIQNHPSVFNAQAFKTIDNYIEIDIKQKTPIARIFNTRGESFYIVTDGTLMPLSTKYTAHVPVFSGKITESYNQLSLVNIEESEENDPLLKKTLLDEVFKLSQYINEHAFWKCQIEQVYVNKDSEFELIPRVGNHRIVLGEAVDIDEKFKKLMIFYQKGLSKTGWNEFSQINLKYKDQVVCVKRY